MLERQRELLEARMVVQPEVQDIIPLGVVVGIITTGPDSSICHWASFRAVIGLQRLVAWGFASELRPETWHTLPL